MPKYLFKASYTKDGLQGLLKEGGSGRRDAIQTMIAGLGGSVETFHFAFGDHDVYTVVDLPDDKAAAAAALAASASGTVRVSTTVLLTPEQVDEATKLSVNFRPAGT